MSRPRSTGITLALLAAWLSVSMPADAAPSCGGRRATIVGTNSRDVIKGTDGPDVIVAGGKRDLIHGLGGNDRICGGTGDDAIYGEDGNDRLFGDEDQDFLVPGPGHDRIVGGAHAVLLCQTTDEGDTVAFGSRRVVVSLLSGRARGDGRDILSGIESVVGSRRNDRIQGNDDVNCLRGEGGDNTVLGGGGNDLVSGGKSDDNLFGEAGEDGVLGGRGDDMLLGGTEDDSLFGHSGTDSADGGPHVNGDSCDAETEVNCEF